MKDYFLIAHQLTVLICVILSTFNAAIADDRQVIDYNYDQSGNLVEKNINVTLDSFAPSVSAITPAIVRRNAVTPVTIDGTDLKNAQIVTDVSGLVVSHVQSSSTQLSFDLNTLNDVPLGTHTLVLSTLSGQVLHRIEVYPQLPQMVIRPTPLALAMGASTEVIFGISNTDVIDHPVTLSVADSNIVNIDAVNFVIRAGERFPANFVHVTGLSKGTTTLTFSSPELGNQVFTVIVADAYRPAVGSQVNLRSDLLGVVLPTNSPDLDQIGPLTNSLSVVLTPLLPPVISSQQLQVSPVLSVVFGRAFTEVAPRAVAADQNAVLTVTGNGLSAITGIAITPPDGVTLGVFQVNAAGTVLTVPVSVAADVTFSTRSLKLWATSGEISSVRPELEQLIIGGLPPVIDAISPVVASRLSTQALNISGKNFDGGVKVSIVPPQDMSIGNKVTVNADHTSLSVALNIGEYAATGPRVVTVETVNGVTKKTGFATNTLNVVNAVSGENLITSSLLGVSVGTANVTVKTVELFSPTLGVIRGAGISNVQPTGAMKGQTLSLTVEGYALDTVTQLNFEPSQGVTVGVPQIAADGLSLTVELTIAADAQEGVRQLSFVSSAKALPFTKVVSSRFEILGPLPQLDYISPNFIIAGKTTAINIHGKAFDSLDLVRVEPAQGLTISVPRLSSDKTVITVQVTADSSAQRGVHTVIVGTNSGESSTAVSVSNQLNIVDTEVLSINNSLVSPLLGVQKGINAGTAITQDYTIASDLLGVLVPVAATPVDKAQYSQPLSVIKGAFIDAITPAAVQTGLTSSITITGKGLQNVTSIDMLPNDGFAVSPAFNINAAGTEISVDVSVAANTDKTLRRIIVHQSGDTSKAVLFVKPEAALLAIAGGLPTINSISPVLQVANSQFELLVRGQNLQEVTAVHAYNSHGTLEPLLVFGAPVVNADGTELRTTVIVDRLVSSGAKAIVLAVPIGQTSIVPAATNTLTIDTVTN